MSKPPPIPKDQRAGPNDRPDIAKVGRDRRDEFGFADLLQGSGHGPGGWGDVAQIELFANSKPR